MAFYQIKLKKTSSIFSYDTYRASSVEDAVRQFLESEARLKKTLAERHEPGEIEEVRLLLDIDDPETALKTVNDMLERSCGDLHHLGEILNHVMFHGGASYWELESFINSVKEKSEQILSLLAAQYDFEENKSYYFSGKEREESQDH